LVLFGHCSRFGVFDNHADVGVGFVGVEVIPYFFEGVGIVFEFGLECEVEGNGIGMVFDGV
jgi:hypothetical protein